MAISQIYVDPSIAADSGAGTVGDPYGDLEYALEQAAKGTDGTQFNIKAGTAEVLEFALDIVTDWGTPAAVTPIVFRGYTAAANDGGIGEINNGGANVSIVDATTLDFVHFIDLKIGNCGTAKIIDLDRWCSFQRCEIWGSSADIPVYVDQGSHLNDCYLHGWTNAGTAGKFVQLGGLTSMTRCFVDCGTVDCSAGIHLNSVPIYVCGNVVRCNHIGAEGIRISNTRCLCLSNTVYNEAAGDTWGIRVSTSSCEGVVIRDNVVEGWSGSGGIGIGFSSATSRAIHAVTNNLCADNETNTPTFAGDLPLLVDGNSESASGVLTDPDNDDFTVGTEGKEGATVQVFRGAASSTNKEDAGACQRLESGGGGGGGAWGFFG